MRCPALVLICFCLRSPQWQNRRHLPESGAPAFAPRLHPVLAALAEAFRLSLCPHKLQELNASHIHSDLNDLRCSPQSYIQQALQTGPPDAADGRLASVRGSVAAGLLQHAPGLEEALSGLDGPGWRRSGGYLCHAHAGKLGCLRHEHHGSHTSVELSATAYVADCAWASEIGDANLQLHLSALQAAVAEAPGHLQWQAGNG